MPAYFIRAGECGPVKIGWALKPTERLRGLQTGHHDELRIIRLVDTERRGEVWLHSHFSSYRIRGEWYDFVDAMLTIEVPVFEVSISRGKKELPKAAQDFRSWRRRLELTQFEAAEALGMSKRQICSYETGEAIVPLSIELSTKYLEQQANTETAA